MFGIDYLYFDRVIEQFVRFAVYSSSCCCSCSVHSGTVQTKLLFRGYCFSHTRIHIETISMKMTKPSKSMTLQDKVIETGGVNERGRLFKQNLDMVSHRPPNAVCIFPCVFFYLCCYKMVQSRRFKRKRRENKV